MNIIALDDEIASLNYVVNMVRETEPSANVHGFREASEMFSSVRQNMPDVAFLDINLGADNGINVARKLKGMNPKINIIFCTAYDEYAVQAVSLHSSGYIVKPAEPEDIRHELDNLLYPCTELPQSPVKLERAYARTFGNFDLFINGRPVEFKLAKAKEMLAYLIDRDGSSISRKELAVILFEDREYDRQVQNYISKIYKALKESLDEVGLGKLVCKGHNQYYLDKTLYYSDLQEYRDGTPGSINKFRGEYMSQYSWAEDTLGQLYNEYHEGF